MSHVIPVRKLAREHALFAISNMPEEFSLEELIDKMLFVLEIDAALQEEKESPEQGVSTAEARRLLAEWRK